MVASSELLTFPPANLPPTAVAGADQVVLRQSLVQLDGNASNDDQTPTSGLSFAWTLNRPAGSQAKLTGATTALPTFVPDLFGTFQASLIVTDALGAESQADTVDIFSHDPPTALAGADFEVRPGSVARLDGSASNDDATPAAKLLFSWNLVAKPPGSGVVLQDAATARPSLILDLPGDYRLSLTVEHGHGAVSTPDEVVVTANLAPTAAILASSTLAQVGIWIELDGQVSSDPENDSLTYVWSLEQVPDGSQASLPDPTAAQTRLLLDRPGEYRVRLVVSDSLGEGPSATVTITGTPIPVLEVPTLAVRGRLLLIMALALAALALLRRS